MEQQPDGAGQGAKPDSKIGNLASGVSLFRVALTSGWAIYGPARISRAASLLRNTARTPTSDAEPGL